jgi:hypothetical protein
MKDISADHFDLVFIVQSSVTIIAVSTCSIETTMWVEQLARLIANWVPFSASTLVISLIDRIWNGFTKLKRTIVLLLDQ